MAQDYRQNPNLDLQELIAQGKEAAPEFNEIVRKVFSDLRADHPDHFSNAVVETGQKSDERIVDKVNGDYRGVCSDITDIIRGRIIVNSAEEIQIVRDYARKMSDEYDVTSLNDRFATPSGTGFRDVNMTLRLSNGHVAEFRFEQKDMVEYGKLSHYVYEKSQEIERAAIAAAAERGDPVLHYTPEQKEELRINKTVNNYLHQVAADIVDQDMFLDEDGKRKILDAHLKGAAHEIGTPDANRKINELIEEAKEAVRLKEEKQALEKERETEALSATEGAQIIPPPAAGQVASSVVIEESSLKPLEVQQSAEPQDGESSASSPVPEEAAGQSELSVALPSTEHHDLTQTDTSNPEETVRHEEALLEGEQIAQSGTEQVISVSEDKQTAAYVIVEEASHTEGSSQQTQEARAEEPSGQAPEALDGGVPQQENESRVAAAAVENRIEILAQEAVEARALADQKTIELGKAQELADEKTRIAEKTAVAAAKEIDAFENAIQLLKDETSNLPPSLVEVNNGLCDRHQAEIDALNAEVARTAAEAEVAREAVEAILPEQQEAEAKALEAELALKAAEAQRQEEEQKALEARQAEEEAMAAEEAKKAEEAIQQKEEEARQAEEEAQQREEVAQRAEEIAQQKEEVAQEAKEIAQQKAEEAEQAEEIALQKEEEAKKAEEVAKEANEKEQGSEEALKAEELAKEKAEEAVQARLEADQKAEEAKQAEEIAEQKAAEAHEAREDATLKAEDAKQAEEIAEQKGIEAAQARAAITEEATVDNVEAQEKAVAQEITGHQSAQTSQHTEEAVAAVTEETEAVPVVQENALGNSVAEEAGQVTANGEQTESVIHEDGTKELVTSDEVLVSNQVSAETTESGQTEETAQQRTTEASQAIATTEEKAVTTEQAEVVEIATPATTVEAELSQTVQGDVQGNSAAMVVGLVEAVQEEDATHQEGTTEAVSSEGRSSTAQISSAGSEEVAPQENTPLTASKMEVLETLENETEEEETPSQGNSEGKSATQEEEPAIQQTVHQTAVDSAVSAPAVETIVLTETAQEQVSENFTTVAYDITGTGGGGGGMCFVSCFDSYTDSYHPKIGLRKNRSLIKAML